MSRRRPTSCSGCCEYIRPRTLLQIWIPPVAADPFFYSSKTESDSDSASQPPKSILKRADSSERMWAPPVAASVARECASVREDSGDGEGVGAVDSRG